MQEKQEMSSIRRLGGSPGAGTGNLLSIPATWKIACTVKRGKL